MSRIPQAFIDELLERLDIVEVIDHRVKLKKTGKNYSACCPFHDEKTPSFTVSPDKQFYYCFGCGASGNALGFIMEFERTGFIESVEQLAHLCGLEVPREEQSSAASHQEQKRKRLYQLLEDSDEFFQRQLRQHPGREKAINYLKNRGLDGRIARDYGMGYAPPGWDNLLKTLGTAASEREDLKTAGMLIQPENTERLYDRFRQRIMFPIRDSRGRTIAFGGRVLDDSKPKYLNSPETPVFHKGRELYGLYEARNAYRQLPRLLVVEGYMDVVALAQFGIRYGVATLGTACGPEHLERAFRYTSEVVFCFDGDGAGRRAATRALEAALPSMTDGRQVKFLFLPEGEDPDTLVRQVGAEKFEHMITMAVPLEDYLFDAAAEGINIRTMEGRAHLSKRAAPLLARLPKGVFRELMFEALANRTGLNRATLDELVTTPEALPSAAPPPEPEPEARLSAAELQSELPYPESEYMGGDNAPPEFDSIPAHAYEDDLQHSTPSDRPSDLPQHSDEAHYLPATEVAPNVGTGRGRYLVPPHHKAIALLLSYPALAKSEPDHDFWLGQGSAELRQLGRLLKLLHTRSHYVLSQIMGHWRANYGAEQTEQLAHMAGLDLLQAATRISHSSEARENIIDYDTQTAFTDSIGKAREQLASQQGLAARAQLRQTSGKNLSREEKVALVAKALANKK